MEKLIRALKSAIPKRQATVNLLCLLLFALPSCTGMRMLLKGKPQVDDFKKYAVSNIKPGDAARDDNFIYDTSKSSLIDSITFNSTEPYFFGKQVNLKTFLRETNTKQFLILHKDTVLYNYTGDNYQGEWINTFSISKSLISLLLGIAINEGFISSLDDPIVKYIPEAAKNKALTPLRIRHLLTMTSGLKFTKLSRNLVKLMRSDEAQTYFTPDIRKYLLKSERQFEPGQYWVYSNLDAELLGWVIENATKKSISDYFESSIWRKIGAKNNAGWTVDSRGKEKVHCCFYTSASDLAKIGKLFTDPEQAIVPKEWIDRLIAFDTTPIQRPPGNNDLAIMKHHYLWWKPLYPSGADLQANGVNGQFLYVDPVHSYIIVKLSDKNHTGYPFRKIVSTLAGIGYKTSIPRYKVN